MPYFRRERALEDHLPLAFQEVCERLIDFDARVTALREMGDRDRTSTQLRELHHVHEELLEASKRVLGPERDATLVEESNQAFVTGVLALHHYSSTAIGGLPEVDSVGSRTLSHFKTDWELGLLDEETLREKLNLAFAIGEGWSEVNRAMSQEIDELAIRHRLITALDARLSVDSPEGIFRLFDRIFIDNPFQEGDVGLVRTGTSLFFCIPYTGRALDVEGYENRSADQKQRIAQFIENLQIVRQEHFPVFGFFRGERACRDLVLGLSEDLGEPPEKLAAVLTTMVSVLRTKDIDKYLVHDVWGHQWQAHLFPFEEQYQESGRFRRLPALDEQVTGEDGWRGSLGSTLEQAARWIERDGTLNDGFWEPYLSAVF